MVRLKLICSRDHTWSSSPVLFPQSLLTQVHSSRKLLPQGLSLVLLLGRELDQGLLLSENVLRGRPCSAIVEYGCPLAPGTLSLLFLECLHRATAEIFTLENRHGAQMEGDAHRTSHTSPTERIGTMRKTELGGCC